MKRSLISVLAVTTILIITAAILAGCRYDGKHRRNWVGYGRPAGMAMNRFPGMGGGLWMGRGQRTGGGPVMGEVPLMGRQRPEAGKAALYLNHTQDLKLTDDQVKKLKDIETSFLKDMINGRAKLAAASVDLNRLLDSDNPDMAAVEKNVRAISELRADLELAIIRGNSAADVVLTAAQKKIIRDLPGRISKNLPVKGMRGRQGMMMPHRQGQTGGAVPSPYGTAPGSGINR